MGFTSRLLRLLFSVESFFIRLDWRRRAAIRAGCARDAGAARLDYTNFERNSVAGEACSLLLADDHCLQDVWRERLGGAIAVRDRRVGYGVCAVLVPTAF